MTPQQKKNAIIYLPVWVFATVAMLAPTTMHILDFISKGAAAAYIIFGLVSAFLLYGFLQKIFE